MKPTEEKTSARVVLLADALAKEKPIYIGGEAAIVSLIKWTPTGIIFCAAGPYGAEVAYPIDTEMSFKPPEPKLKPCPWDFSVHDDHVLNMTIQNNAYQIRCSCGAFGPPAKEDRDAIAAWNRRA